MLYSTLSVQLPNVHNSLITSTLEGKIYWYDANNEFLSSQDIDCTGINPNLSLCTEASVEVPSEAHLSHVKFTHPKLQDGSTDPLVYGISVKNKSEYIYVQSLKYTFNLTYQSKPFSQTSNLDVKNLYDYLIRT